MRTSGGREGLGGYSEGPGGVKRPSQRARRGWEALLEGRESLGGPSGGPVGVGMGWETLLEVTRGFGRVMKGQKALLEGQERSGGTPGGPAVIKRPIQMAMMCWKGSRGSLGGLGGVGRPFRRAEKGPEALLEGRKKSGGYSGGL